MDLQNIRQFFGTRMVIFNTIAEHRLTPVEKDILFNIGMPDYNGYGGTYLMQSNLSIIDGHYLKFATRKGDETEYSEFIDLQNHKIVFRFYSEEFSFLNSNLEAYLNYLYIYEKNFTEVIDPEKFGNYELNHQKYADELKKRLLQYNDDVLKGSWSALIEEMGYGVI